MHRVKEVFWWGSLMCGGITVAVSFLAITWPHVLLRMFLNEPEVIKTGVDYLHIVGACYVFFAIMFVGNGIINGAGHTFATTAISLVSLWFARVPLAAYLIHRMNDVRGVWYAMAFSLFIAMAMSLAYYFSGYWKRSIVHHPPVEDISSTTAPPSPELSSFPAQVE